MSEKYLVAYATRYGSTEEVAQAVAKTLGEFSHSVDCKRLREVKTLEDFDAAVIGAPLYMYRWHKDALRFLSRHRKSLTVFPTAVFALGPVRDPHDEHEWQDSRHQLDQELSRFAWFKPVVIQLFGGKYDPKSLGFPFNKLAGDTPATDIRDWAAIEAWTRELPEKFAPHLSNSSRSR
jgi:menaquinone-dependent protoporphyrinogen oxidase